MTVTGPCDSPTGAHRFVDGSCARCGAGVPVAAPRPLPTAPVSLVKSYAPRQPGEPARPVSLHKSYAPAQPLPAPPAILRNVRPDAVHPGMLVRRAGSDAGFREVDEIEQIGARVLVGYADDAVFCDRFRASVRFDVLLPV